MYTTKGVAGEVLAARFLRDKGYRIPLIKELDHIFDILGLLVQFTRYRLNYVNHFGIPPLHYKGTG
ncbi:MAG: hypothetical protein IJC52_03590, partial [Clostridia bacterium]|nr:hypothetical protein [Clostridia bacterium]